MKGEGEVLALIHSGFTDLRLWDDQFDFFGKYFKVIRYDIRGFGKSDRPSEPKAGEHLKNMFLDTSLEWALGDISNKSCSNFCKVPDPFQKLET